MRIKKWQGRKVPGKIRARGGTTLVELVAAMAVFGIMMTMAVGILSPAAKLLLRLQAGTSDVTGVPGGTVGDVLEFVNPDKYVTLVSTGGCGATEIMVGPTKLSTEGEVAEGRLLKRYYTTESAGTDQYCYKDTAGNPVARALGTAFADEYYMGNDLKITFSFPSAVADGDKVAYLEAHVALCDSAGRVVVQEDAVLDLRYEAVRKDAVTAVLPAGP